MAMARRALSMAQARFLGDTLGMVDFEQQLQNSPVKFLERFLLHYRIKQPFSLLAYGTKLKYTGKPYLGGLDEAQLEIFACRGGPCEYHVTFIKNFMNSIGICSNIEPAFHSNQGAKKDAFHFGVFCWDVERKGDMYYLEAGSAMTCFSLSDLSNLFRTDERAIAAGPIMASLQHRYQVCNGKKMLAALNETPSPNANVPDSSNKKRHISDLIDIPHMAEFINDQEHDCLVLLCAKDKINTGLWPLFSAEQNGAWFPSYVFFGPFNNFCLDKFKTAERTLGKVIDRYAANGVSLVGFGKKSGDFMNIRADSITRTIGTAEEVERMKKTGIMDTPTPLKTEVAPIESEEQMMAIINEEFPQLVQQCKDQLEVRAKYLRANAGK